MICQECGVELYAREEKNGECDCGFEIDLSDKFENKTVINIFETDLKNSIPGYKLRPGQLKMSVAIESCIDDNGKLIVEASTGTGKSFAYLVPAVLSGKKTVVATGNIALQEQLIEKDLPFLKTLLPNFSFTIKKGIGNYVCDEAISDTMNEAGFFKDADSSLSKLLAWAEKSKTGDKSDYQGDKKYWSKISTTSEICTGEKCQFFETCIPKKMDRLAKGADVIVCNHHLYIADMKVRDMTDGNVSVLPPHEVVIFDEAHNFPDVARSFLGDSFSFFKVIWPLKILNRFDESGWREKIEKKVSKVFKKLKEFFESKSYNGLQFTMQEEQEILAIVLPIVKEFRSVIDFLETEMKLKTYDEKIKARAQISLNKISELFKFLEFEDGENSINFLKSNGDFISFERKLLDVSDYIRKSLDDKTVIHTSATIATGNDFSFFKREAGADGYNCLTVESPFDFSQNVLMIVPVDHPLPNADQWQWETNEKIYDIVMQSGGKTLCLFTSYKSLRSCEKHLKRKKLPFEILSQDSDIPRKKLVQNFKKNITSVLLGTGTFWTGIDVQGAALSTLIIDKLPFPHPMDPIVNALNKKAGRSFFSDYMIPKSIIEIKQGFGRLIRTESDYGTVVCFDKRIVTKAYGMNYLKALPDTFFRKKIDRKIESFFEYKKQKIESKKNKEIGHKKTKTESKEIETESKEIESNQIKDIDFYRRRTFAQLGEFWTSADSNILRKLFIKENYKVSSFTEMTIDQMIDFSEILVGLSDQKEADLFFKAYVKK